MIITCLEKKIITKNNSNLIRGSGVCTEKFKSNKQKKIYDLIFHSRIIKDKGVFELINAIKILRNQNVYFKTLFLGDLDKENRSFISEEQVNFWVKEKLIIWKKKQTMFYHIYKNLKFQFYHLIAKDFLKVY